MLTTPQFDAPAEPLLGANESLCIGDTDRAGVRAFLEFVLRNQGGEEGRIDGPCGGKSGHAAGRAWDWMIDAHDPAERARADELIDWLLANDAEMFRRAGLYYIIWDKRIWSANNPEWRPYDGYDEHGACVRAGGCRNAHTNHVHFSFNAAGADGLTSFYDWLKDGSPSGPTPTPLASVGTGPLLAGFAVGFLVMAFAANTKQGRRLARRVRTRLGRA